MAAGLTEKDYLDQAHALWRKAWPKDAPREPQYPHGEIAHVRVEVGRPEQRADVAPAAVVHRVGDLDMAASRGEAVAGDLLRTQDHRLGRDRVDALAQHGERHSRTDQRTEQHVTARTRGGVDPDAHRDGSADEPTGSAR